MKKALGLGILGSFFFAFTFILNRSMNLSGGFWMWSAVLRYVYTLPILAVILWKNHQMREILEEIRKRPGFWILWSTVGFGLFYAPLSLASTYGESWLIASTWQITIVAGVLLTESSKSPASIARSNKQWVGGCLCQWELKAPTDRSRSDCVHEQVAKRIANIRLTTLVGQTNPI